MLAVKIFDYLSAVKKKIKKFVSDWLNVSSFPFVGRTTVCMLP